MTWIYRDFQIRDHKKLSEMVGSAFGLDSYTQNRFLLCCLERHYFLQYLRGLHYIKIAAEEKGGPVGILAAEIGEDTCKNHKYRYHLLSLLYAIPLLFTAVGKNYFQNARLVGKADGHLISCASSALYPAELRLFCVDKSCRGQGIGRHLLAAFQENCVRRGERGFRLFTDSYCDVAYYRRNGFREEAETKIQFSDEKYPSAFFLFSKSFS